MMGISLDHCQVVRDSLKGEKSVDEQTFTSLAILTERLERLQKLGKNFSDVAFSSAVRKLTRQKSTITIG